MEGYTLVATCPSVVDFRRLREAAGMESRAQEAAERGLKNTLFGVSVLHEGQVVGMGRVVGDGGCVYQIVDVAVLPEHQRQGLGRQIMQTLMDYLHREAPPSAYVCLIADGPAKHLYASFGFQPTAPASIGMAFIVPEKT
jgi:GNAT superfamily N-acetyltransferase